MRKRKKKNRSQKSKSQLDQLAVIFAAILLAAVLNDTLSTRIPTTSPRMPNAIRPAENFSLQPPVGERFSTTNLPSMPIQSRGRY